MGDGWKRAIAAAKATRTTPKTTGETPGPWRALPSGRVVSDAYPNTDPRHYLAQVYDGGICGEINAADARLIAAAPAMREALEALVASYVSLVDSGDCGFFDAALVPEIANARAALAQARGEKE